MKSITGALRAAIGQRATERPAIEPVPKSRRIDGKVCLVTGANSGLGKAVAIDLAARGGRVLMACRGGHPEAGEDVKGRSGSSAVQMLKVDLADLASVHRLGDELRAATPRIDIAVLNAGLMPRQASQSRQGFELMFAVHFLANRVLVGRLLEDGLLQPRMPAAKRRASFWCPPKPIAAPSRSISTVSAHSSTTRSRTASSTTDRAS